MVEKRNCSFCGDPIEPGTGKMYIKKDGTVYSFCSNKCKKNRIDLGRVPRRTRWTVRYSELKASTLQREKAKTEPKGKDDPEKPVQRSKKKAAPKKKAVVKEESGKPKESPGPVAKQTQEPAPTEPESQEEGS